MTEPSTSSNGQTRLAYILGVPLAPECQRQWPQMEEVVRGRDLIAHVEGNFAELTLEVGGRLHVDDDGSLTAAGRERNDLVESVTDTLALSALDALSDDEVETLFQALTPITRAVVAGGDVLAVTPMSLRQDELHDGSAHLAST